MYIFKNNSWEKILSEDLTENEIEKIVNALEIVSKRLSNPLDKIYGKKIQNRGTQITYSGLGEDAPIEEKQKWDPDQSKKREIVEELKKIIPEFSIKTGGSTSVDINRQGIDKAYGLKKLMEYLNIQNKSDILFIGDAIYPQGNDYSAKEFGVDCIKVSGPSETKKVIQNLLN
jgi:HAD superfamily hydrolase (TIGR01484 family)